MFSAGVSGIRAYGPSALAFAIVILLAGILVERRILTPRQASPSASLGSIPLVAEDGLPGLRRIVLDPCTGLEKAQAGAPSSARTAKVD